MVPGSVVTSAQNAEERAETLETGRLLNINEEMTRLYPLADKGGAASENVRRDGRAMRVRKGDLVMPRGHIGTRETGSRCLDETPQFEVTSLQSIGCVSMCPPPQKKRTKDRNAVYTASNHPIVIVGTWFSGAPTMSAGGVVDVDGVRKATNKYVGMRFVVRSIKPLCLECQERIFHPTQLAGGGCGKQVNNFVIPPSATSGSCLRHSGFSSVPHTT